ncbi:hypothetical protein tinsulaeT_30550 [Thalassotalea insulae]|uniref:Tetratricopeptide repeat protein n=1 Tax=Thalassotalea insulae TaxID=2056778 RepID=A0ABQ6GY94_9GAMM|nr:hypothetical protein [Thalassotalea insulae]GLX79715.1 hypothetical protein tinsulaeT_30550 [Thalassotalea insulae]
MKKLLCSLPSVLVAGAIYLAPSMVAELSVAQAEENSKASVRVPAMRNRVYTQLARAQQIADQGDKAAGLAVLDEVKGRIDSLNSYEKAMLWNFYGFMHYGAEDMPKAIVSFKQVIAQEAIPESLRLSTLYSLAQLSMQQQDYQATLGYLSKWQSLNSKPLSADQHILFAQVYYQSKDFAKALTSIHNAMEVAKADNKPPKENWLILQRASYYELKQPENVTKVMEQLVRLYSKPEYWLQLAGMYGEIGAEDKQMAVMETAWQAGYVSKPQDIISLAQLYRYHGAPYKAAKVLDEAIALGNVVASEKHLEMLAQSYIAAKDDAKAIPVLIKASEIVENGKYDAQLAQVYLNSEKWSKAIDSAELALEKGDIARVGDMHLVLGMSYFNLQKFDESLAAFKAAEGIKSSEKTAKQWHKYVKREQGQYERLAMLN